MRKAILTFVLLLSGFAPTRAADDSAAAPPLRFLPQWSPQAQFAGYYVAEDLGLYAKAGLNVEIMEGGPRRPASVCLEDGKTDLATLWLATGIGRRAAGVPLVNLAQIVRHSSMLLVARKSSGILRPEDLKGRKVSLWNDDFQIQPRALFRKLGIEPRVVPQSGTMNLFLHGGTDAASAMWYNEYHVLKMSGLDEEELTVLRFADLGYDFPEDGVYVLESTLAARPGPCRAFVEASIAGWSRAFAKPAEALASVARRMNEAGLPFNAAHQKWMLDCMKTLVMTHEAKTSRWSLDEEDFNAVVQALSGAGTLPSPPLFSEFRPGIEP